MKLTLNEIRPEVFELFIGGYRDSQGPVEYRQLYRASSVESEGHWVLLLAKETLSDRMQLTMGHTLGVENSLVHTLAWNTFKFAGVFFKFISHINPPPLR